MTDGKKLELQALKPINIADEEFPEAIQKISPTFISIYKEAVESRERRLFQIAGPGFRKAFEFLIKDYAKHLAPGDKHKNIEESFSGKVVDEYIRNPRIQAVAKRALWLGNDETHYLRKWEKHDIEDLITLIKLTVNWVEIEQLSKSYVEDMPDNQ